MRKILSIIILFLVIAVPAVLTEGASAEMGVIGKLIAVERVDEDDCKVKGDNRHCSFAAVERGLSNLKEYMKHFRCVTASGLPNIQVDSNYEPLTRHDPGLVIMIEASDLRCAINPRSELILIDEKNMASECSRLSWKCNIIWIPDYDSTIALIGKF